MPALKHPKMNMVLPRREGWLLLGDVLQDSSSQVSSTSDTALHPKQVVSGPEVQHDNRTCFKLFLLPRLLTSTGRDTNTAIIAAAAVAAGAKAFAYPMSAFN